MKQYLLSIYQPDGDPPPAEVLAEIMRDVRARGRGAPGCGRVGVHRRAAPAEHGDRGARSPATGMLDDRRPVRRGQGAHRRLTDHQGGRPRRGARVGPQGWPGRRRSRSRCGRSRASSRTDAGVPASPHPEIERVFREEYGRAVAVLVRVFGDIDLAEEAVQDAFAMAVATLARRGLPPSPAGWIITTARNRAIDRLRREALARRPARPGGAAARRRRAVPRRVRCATTGCA